MMPKVLSPSAAAALLIGATAPAHAANLQFQGLALGTCSLASPLGGSIGLQPDLKSWSTVTPATINAINTASSTLSVTRDSDWLSGPAGIPTTTFSHSGSIVGVNPGSLSGSGATKSATLLLPGTNLLSVSVSAAADSTYPAGAYTYQVTVTCVIN